MILIIIESDGAASRAIDLVLTSDRQLNWNCARRRGEEAEYTSSRDRFKKKKKKASSIDV